MKKLIILMLALAVILSLTITAFAAEGEGGDPAMNHSIGVYGDNGEDGNTSDDNLYAEDLPDDRYDNNLGGSGDAGDLSPDDAAGQDGSGQDSVPSSDVQDSGSTESPAAPIAGTATEKPEQDGEKQYQPTTAAETEATEETAEAEEDAGSSGDTIKLIAIIGGAALLILILVIAAILLRNKKASGGGSKLTVEVLEGVCYNADFKFSLRHEVTIGTDQSCGLVFVDAQMLPVHAVIRQTDGKVTLRECSDTRNTYINGMKIFAENRLRSDDVVTIGETSFAVDLD